MPQISVRPRPPSVCSVADKMHPHRSQSASAHLPQEQLRDILVLTMKHEVSKLW